MDNHYHWVLHTRQPNLARLMRHLNGVYTQTFNRRHSRVGHVLQGRYQAILVDREAYYLEVCRDVVLNPVRARRAAKAADWVGSSYRATLGVLPAPEWLDVDCILAAFAATPAKARRLYAAFIDQGLAGNLWDSLRGQIYLGDEDFAERMTRHASECLQQPEIPKRQRLTKPLTLADYAQSSSDGRQAMAKAYRSGAYTMAVHRALFDREPSREKAGMQDLTLLCFATSQRREAPESKVINPPGKRGPLIAKRH